MMAELRVTRKLGCGSSAQYQVSAWLPLYACLMSHPGEWRQCQANETMQISFPSSTPSNGLLLPWQSTV